MLVATLARKASPAGALIPRESGETVDWNGWIAAVPDGTYTFTVPSGGIARLAIDGRVVADGTTSTPLYLDAAPRAFDFQDRRAASGPQASGWTTDRPSISWSRNGGPATPLPRSVLFARKPRALTMTVVAVLDGFAAASQWMWVLALVGAACAVALAVWSVL